MTSETQPVTDSHDDEGTRMGFVLIVDDEIDITTIFSMLLELQGFEVVTASNGLQALDIVNNRLPDIIVSDCMMPIMNGLEFCRQVRKNLATSNIPIVLMSAAPALLNLSDAGHDVFLEKPFDFNDLLLEITKLLASRQGVGLQRRDDSG